MARDWLTAFRPASFRGVPFKVDGDGPRAGRRLSVHEISGGEVAETEDMGSRWPGLRIAAYVAGDAADGAGLALEAACKAPGAALLMLPMDLPLMAHCTDIQRDRRKDEAGILYYDLEFTPAGSAGVAIGGIGALESVYAAGVGTAAAVLGGL